MSVRATSLCDHDRCNDVAAGVCRLCKRDTCEDHLLADKHGGLVVSIELRDLNGATPRRPPRGQTPQPAQFVVFPNDSGAQRVAMSICRSCAMAVARMDAGNSFQSPLMRNVAAVAEDGVVALRTALVEDGLAKEPSSSE